MMPGELDPTQTSAFLVFAFFSPPFVAIIKQAGFSPAVNALIAQAAYIGVGILAAVWSGVALTVENAVPLAITATLVGRAAYSMIWNQIGTGPDGTAPSIDARLTTATSLVK